MYNSNGQMPQSYGQMPQSYGQPQGYGSQATNYMKNTLVPQATNYMNNTLVPQATNYMNGLKDQYTPLLNNAINQGFSNGVQMNPMNQGQMNQGQMNQGPINQGSDRFGIPVSTYKQGFLNAIARWNVASGTSNAFQRMGNNPMSVEQVQSVRDQRIRQALNEVLAMPNLGKYQALNAIGDATGNYLKYMVNGFSNRTRGGRRRRRGSHKTRRHK